MRSSALARLAVMGFLAIVLLIPLQMVHSVVRERAARRSEAAASIGATWGGPQTIAGPVVTIPFTVSWTDANGRVHQAARAVHLLPKDVRVEAALETERRQRGIFDVVVYRTEIKVQGHFVRPDLSWVRPEPSSIDWGGATIGVGVSDPRALTRRTAIQWNGRQEPFTSGVADTGLFRAGVKARAPGLDRADATDLPFAFTLSLNGTRDLRFLPTAEETAVQVTARWPHPSFMGAPLPETRDVRADGFTAAWRVPDFGRPYAARWMTPETEAQRQALDAAAESSAFGVSLIQPVDIYQQAERAVKYAVLFVALTFLVFFLWEIFRAVLLHPVQYAFVGFALCLFYLLVVSISEHAGFDTAYAAASAATIALVGGYARAVLGGGGGGASVAGSLAILYGFLYLLLRLEDYALLAGTLGLFVVLAAVMYVTRRMDWYELKLGGVR